MSDSDPQVVVAVDPGRAKCGIAAVAADGGVLGRRIVPADQVGRAAWQLATTHGASTIVLGGRTGAGEAWERLTQATSLPIAEVEEHMTTLQARRRYWRENPPRGLWRLVPTSLRVPPEPYDDWAAVILAERYLGLADTEAR
ncbi:MAG: pre-16S rRNA-processing nuclease YqgF [Armatimonadota bacterium]|nr:pre-16S rRNA-processing nuclease YqgF [Armatimonadota bacterium]